MRSKDIRPGNAGPGKQGDFYGVYPGKVTGVADPEQTGRVQVTLPWLGGDGDDLTTWARVAVLMAGRRRGTWFMPEVDDEVLVAFEAGDLHRPYVLGALWNSEDEPPEESTERNDFRTIQSRSGMRLRFDDSDAAKSLTIDTPGGASITLDEAGSRVEIRDDNGNRVLLDNGGIHIETAAEITLSASTLRVSASALTVDAAMSTFSGVVKCDTMISNSVVSASYTPGAGNIW